MQFGTPLQRTEWTRIVKRVGRVSGTRALGGLEVSGADQAMMGHVVVLGKVISEVIGSGTPIHDVGSLADTILYPIKVHVHGFGLALAGGPVGDAGCAGVVSLDRSGGLLVDHFFQGNAQGGGVFGIVKKAGEFSFGRGGHDILEDDADGMKGDIVGGWCGRLLVRIGRFGAKEKMASDAAASFGLRQIRGVAMDVEYHVAGSVTEDGVGMGRGVIEEASE